MIGFLDRSILILQPRKKKPRKKRRANPHTRVRSANARTKANTILAANERTTNALCPFLLRESNRTGKTTVQEAKGTKDKGLYVDTAAQHYGVSAVLPKPADPSEVGRRRLNTSV